MKKKSNFRSIDFDTTQIPENCKQIVITQNKTRIIIKNNNSSITNSVENKHSLIMKKVTEFFDVRENFEKFRPILVHDSPLSLRVLDWSTTNWSKKNPVYLTTFRHGYEEKINMFLDYKAHLKAFSKKSFDPFCRRERMMYKFSCDTEERTYITTAAQMNFFKWAIESNILDYCIINSNLIEQDMIMNMRVKVNKNIS